MTYPHIRPNGCTRSIERITTPVTGRRDDGVHGVRGVTAALLARRAVDTMVLTGLATDYCVDATARSALSHGFDVVLVRDGHSPAADGDPVAGLTAAQVVDRHNRLLAAAIHPGGTLHLRAAADVVFRS
ncbi:MAG: isochorismatase family protein [Saccharothrix sp.]|nr:isochorismatase family protein [Saccharothrix sp.]